MREIMQTCGRLSAVTDVPFSLLDGEGRLLRTWPSFDEEALLPAGGAAAIEDFRLQKRDARHPLISFLDPGFLLGVVELEEERFVLIGLVSPYVLSLIHI